MNRLFANAAGIALSGLDFGGPGLADILPRNDGHIGRSELLAKADKKTRAKDCHTVAWQNRQTGAIARRKRQREARDE